MNKLESLTCICMILGILCSTAGFYIPVPQTCVLYHNSALEIIQNFLVLGFIFLLTALILSIMLLMEMEKKRK